MGMRIDDEIYVHGYLDEIRQDKVIIRNEGGYFGTVVDELVEAIPKDQYEARLKADLEAILVELQLEIEELRLDRPLMSRGHECYGFEDKTPAEIQQECSDIIQEKINALGSKTDVSNEK